MGIAYETYPEKGVRLVKTGLEIKKLEKEFPYFSGTGRETGRLQIYHTLLPRWDCREQLWTPELGENAEEIPRELLAACLYRCRPFDRLFVSLEEEDGEYGLGRALHLLQPYLPRMRQVMYVGRESQVSLLLERDYHDKGGEGHGRFAMAGSAG